MNPTRTANERALSAGLIRPTRIYRQEVNRALAADGLSDAQAAPVLHIARSKVMRQNQLAEEIGIKGPSLVRLLDQLCANGLVERHDDEHDRRAKKLHRTLAGEALAERVEELLARIRRRLFAAIDDADLEAGLRILDRLQRPSTRVSVASPSEPCRASPGAICTSARPCSRFFWRCASICSSLTGR